MAVFLRFEVLTAGTMNRTMFWVAALHSVIEVNRRFRGAYCLHHKGGKTSLSASTQNTAVSISFLQTQYRTLVCIKIKEFLIRLATTSF
jgi:hypothetical protein